MDVFLVDDREGEKVLLVQLWCRKAFVRFHTVFGGSLFKNGSRCPMMNGIFLPV